MIASLKETRRSTAEWRGDLLALLTGLWMKLAGKQLAGS